MAFMAMMIAFATGSAFSSEARKIRKDLYLKDKSGLLNIVQLAEAELSLSEVLDRDIQILEQHKDVLQRKINLNKSGFTRSLTGFIVLGGINFASSSIANAHSKYINSLWNGDGDLSIKFTDGVVGVTSWFGLINESHKTQYDQEKFKQLCKDYPELAPRVMVALAAAAVAMVSGLWCIKKVYNMCKFNSISVSMYITKCKTRIERDEAIVAQLKQLKYSAGF